MRNPKDSFFVICTVTLVLFCAGRFGQREESYAGHPLSYWLDAYSESYPDGDAHSSWDAINHIGTNALPQLLKGIIYRKPDRVQKWLANLRCCEPGPGWQWIPKCLTGEPEAQRSSEAILGFDALGSNALPAIPILLKLAERDDPGWNTVIAWNAVTAMSLIGIDSLPALLSLVTNNNADGQFAAIRQLPSMEEKLKKANRVDSLIPVIQILARLACDPQAKCAEVAAEALGDFKLQPEISVPALISAMQDTRATVREKAAYALRQFPEQTQATTAILVRALGDTDAHVLQAVSKSLPEVACSPR